MASYVVLFTTVPASRLSAVRCLEAYRLRWQVELLYKRWKSLGGLDQLPNERDDTILAWLYVKLILGMIVERIGSTAGALSPRCDSPLPSTPPVRNEPQEPDSPRPSTPPARSERPLTRQPWKMASIIWPILVAAILPLSLVKLVACLPEIADRLDSFDDVSIRRQIPTFAAPYRYRNNGHRRSSKAMNSTPAPHKPAVPAGVNPQRRHSSARKLEAQAPQSSSRVPKSPPKVSHATVRSRPSVPGKSQNLPMDSC